jgi:hypothetical protein
MRYQGLERLLAPLDAMAVPRKMRPPINPHRSFLFDVPDP